MRIVFFGPSCIGTLSASVHSVVLEMPLTRRV